MSNGTLEKVESSFLIVSPKTYRYWWTFIPVLPDSRDDLAYRVLRRQWADHTMNTVRSYDGVLRPGPRGAYVEGREDHITPVLFQIWAAFPGTAWVPCLLRLWNIPHGSVSSVRWSYSWEQKRARGMRPDITDIVVSWRDERGDAALVIEAKRMGGKLKPKDLDGGRAYLSLPSIKSMARRHVGFLIDERDLQTAQTQLPDGTPIATWQAMGRAQADAALMLSIEDASRLQMRAFIAKHYADLGMGFDNALSASLDSESFDGSKARYAVIRERMMPAQVSAFFLGSEVVLCARRGIMPAPPHDWLVNEPSLLDLSKSPQPTSERETPLWRLKQQAS